ncbi:MAG: hypothetical protein HOU81_25205 [Hamadaea sp.]|nr:hypothetical protein [Hamadaea sp.]NUT19973.1 hypothetical protein [Hamadaea sp.]
MRQEDIPPDSQLREFLGRIGWTAARTHDIRPDIDAWNERNYIVTDAILEFMSSCGGLEFEYPRNPVVGGSYTCYVSASPATRRIPRSLAATYERRIGQTICPIGQAAGGDLFLVMAADGTTYGCRDRFLARIAADGYHALQAISLRRPMTAVA